MRNGMKNEPSRCHESESSRWKQRESLLQPKRVTVFSRRDLEKHLRSSTPLLPSTIEGETQGFHSDLTSRRLVLQVFRKYDKPRFFSSSCLQD